jgi:transglutaminase-like putative cysteine protease
VWSALGARGLNHKARLELEAIIDKHKGKTPLVVWRELSRSSGHNAEELEAHTHLAEGTAGDRGPAFIGAHRYLGKRTLERIALRSLLHQDSLDDLVRVGDMLQDAGRYPAAKQVFTLATELGPNRADAFTGFAKAMRAMSPGEPAGPMSLDALARASELDPEDARLAAEVRFRRGDDSFAADPGLDAPWLIEPKVFLARAKEKPAPATGVFSRQLHWRRVVRLHSDKRVSQMMHYAREIIVEPRTENERYEGLPGGYGSELLVARVHKKDGTVLAPEEEDTAGPVIRWPPLERGDVVEVAIRTWTEGPVGRRGDAPFYFVDYVGSVDTNPILYNDVVIDAPLGSPLAYDVVGGSADEVKQSESNGRSITQLVWSNPPSIADEPLSPKVSELMPLVVGSIYPSWKSFLGWYEGAIEGFVKPDEQMKRLAEEITQGKKTREEKVEALFTYVADDIRYVNYQSGEWWLPNRPQELLARRQGDCDDKAMLLITLLQAVGIEAKEVLVQTRYTAERRVMESTKVAIPMFDHGIVWLPDESGEGGRYLDATSPQSRYGSLPGMDGGAMVLMVGGEGKLVEAPAPAPADQGVESQWTLELASDGSGKVVANETHVGDNGFYLRMFLGEEDTRAQWVEGNLLNGWFTAVEMDPKVTFDGALPKGAAKVSYSLRSKALARREGHDLIVAVAPATPVTSMLAPLTTRTLPVELPPSAAPQHRRLTMTIVAPASHQFAEAPPDGEADGGAFGKASLEFTLSKDKRKLTVVRDVSLAQWRIPVAEYAAWRKWLQQIDGLFQRGVRLTQK